MAYNNHEEEIECEIIQSYGIFSQGIKFWNKEVNLVSWNGMPAKLDIRNWQRDHAKCGKGIAITREEAEELIKLLDGILKSAPAAGKMNERKPQKRSSSRKQGPSGKSGASNKTEFTEKRTKSMPPVPPSLKPFYRELMLDLNANPVDCKTARNTLLKKYHPDMYTGSASFATRKTIKIKEAYEKIAEWWKTAKE